MLKCRQTTQADNDKQQHSSLALVTITHNQIHSSNGHLKQCTLKKVRPTR